MRPARNTWRSSGEGRRIVWKPTVVSIRRWMMMRPGDRTGNPRLLPEKMKNLLRRMMTRCHRVGFHSIRRRGTSRIDAPTQLNIPVCLPAPPINPGHEARRTGLSRRTCPPRGGRGLLASAAVGPPAAHGSALPAVLASFARFSLQSPRNTSECTGNGQGYARGSRAQGLLSTTLQTQRSQPHPSGHHHHWSEPWGPVPNSSIDERRVHQSRSSPTTRPATGQHTI